MKRDIDLTENNDFSSFNGFREHKDYKKNYYHKSIPWKREAEDKPASLKYEGEFVNIGSLTLQSSTVTDSIDIWDGGASWSSINLTSSPISTSINGNLNITTNNRSYSSDNMVIHYNFEDQKVSWKIKNGTFEAYPNISNDPDEFYTGHVSDIKNKRSLLMKRSKYYKNNIIYNCSVCGKSFKDKPWSHHKRSSFRYDDNQVMCNECYEIESNLKMNNNIKDALEKVTDRWCKEVGYSYSRRLLRRIPEKSRIIFDVPCLSSKIPDEFIKREIPHRYKEWEYEETFEDDLKYIFGELRERNKVYTKGKSKQELRVREEPWQPKGRVRQNYDAMFDRMDWRDMLKLRIGELEGPLYDSSKHEEKFLNTITRINNNIINFTAI